MRRDEEPGETLTSAAAALRFGTPRNGPWQPNRQEKEQHQENYRSSLSSGLLIK
jgi:hypothetical protein